MRITKKAIKEAPKFAIGIDYKASYKPLTIETRLIEAADIYEAMAKADELFDEETVWCLNLYEKTDRVKDDSILYDERLQSDSQTRWHLVHRDEFHIGYNLEGNFTYIC